MSPLIFERPDRRYQRAVQLMVEVLRIVRPHLDPEADPRRIHRELLGLLHTEGVEIITDTMRVDLGLSPRDGKGWTVEEIQALEKARLDAMTRPLQHFLPVLKA